MIDLKKTIKEKNITCENENEFLLIKKLLIEKGLEYDDFYSIGFPGYFHNFSSPHDHNRFTFYRHLYNRYYNYDGFIKAKNIIREIKLENINK